MTGRDAGENVRSRGKRNVTGNTDRSSVVPITN